MTAQTRLILLVLVLAYSVAFGVSQASPASAKRAAEHRLRLSRPRPRPKRAVQSESVAGALGLRAVRFAHRLIGVPYRWGGDSPATGFDCSGFVSFVYRHFGVTLPHSSYADFGLGIRVPRGSLRPGDLVFFDGVGHVGMYVGNGRFIHAPHTGTDVQLTRMSDPWYQSRYDGARRLILAPARRVTLRLSSRPSSNIRGAALGSTWFQASYGATRMRLASSAGRMSAWRRPKL